MKNFYEMLELTSEASEDKINSAYYKLVRKYPSDRYETEFMAVREAYEILSNKKTRKQYDEMSNFSKDVKDNFHIAKEQMQEGESDLSIKLLEKMLKTIPDSLVIKSVLGKAYLQNGNNGKALKTFTELSEAEPKNAAFKGHLALAYIKRGWQKKAIETFQKAVKIDSKDTYLWIGLADAYIQDGDFEKGKQVYENALSMCEEIAYKAIIYFRLITIYIQSEQYSDIYSYVEKLLQIAEDSDEIKESVAWALLDVTIYLTGIDKVEDAAAIFEKASLIKTESEEIREMKKDVELYSKLKREFDRLKEDNKIKETIVSLLSFSILPRQVLEYVLRFENELDFESMEYFCELETIQSYEVNKASIVRLKNEYPELYKIKAEFFSKVLDSSARKKLQADYLKEMDEYLLEDEEFEDIEDEEIDEAQYTEESGFEIREPFVRKEEKIGRNDPCPCGSGKKYKKCCGK